MLPGNNPDADFAAYRADIVALGGQLEKLIDPARIILRDFPKQMFQRIVWEAATGEERRYLFPFYRAHCYEMTDDTLDVFYYESIDLRYRHSHRLPEFEEGLSESLNHLATEAGREIVKAAVDPMRDMRGVVSFVAGRRPAFFKLTYAQFNTKNDISVEISGIKHRMANRFHQVTQRRFAALTQEQMEDMGPGAVADYIWARAASDGVKEALRRRIDFFGECLRRGIGVMAAEMDVTPKAAADKAVEEAVRGRNDPNGQFWIRWFKKWDAERMADAEYEKSELGGVPRLPPPRRESSTTSEEDRRYSPFPTPEPPQASPRARRRSDDEGPEHA
ncbi:MAG: hypothetical protein AB7G06_07650 [Bdellovibrionales bacterium]